MERERLLLAVWAASSLLLVQGVALASRCARLPAPDRPRFDTLIAAGRALWLPLLPALATLAFLAGWALREPDPADEWLSPWVLALAAGVALIAMRAGLRAAIGWRRARDAHPACATRGLWRPQIITSHAFRRAALPDALRAALHHEAAHVRHRDPLRLLLAQLGADLQWPVPGARQRLAAWSTALEIARDDEALATGADPIDLAEGILLAASLSETAPATTTSVQAAIAGADGPRANRPRADRPETALAYRVRRLLRTARNAETARADHPLPPALPPAPPLPVPSRRRVRWPALVATLALGACLASGYAWGEALLRALPGVCS